MRVAFIAGLAVATSMSTLACDESNAVKEQPVIPDSGTAADSGISDAATDAPSDGGPTDCIENPKTHLEIINACTTAVKITKNPTLPKLLPDGGLPPLL